MADRSDVKQGTLALMVLKTLETMGPLHGYGVARRIEQTSGQLLAINYGTLYPSRPNGACRRTIGKRSTTDSRAPAGSASSRKHVNGSARRRFSAGF